MPIDPTQATNPVPAAPARPAARTASAEPTPAMAADAFVRTSPRPGPVARIDQMHPAGADAGYTNGFSNCAPTSMSMVARAFGLGGGLTDAQLITKMAHLGGTTSAGSSPASVVAMARGIGLKAEVHGPRPDLAWIDRQLDAGKLVVAHGNYFGLPAHAKEPRTWKGGHFLVVAGRTPGGEYVLRDPLDAKVDVVSGEALAKFIGSHPSGGHQIAVGR